MINDTIKFIPNHKPLSIIMRHAERESIIDMKNALSALLTPQGKIDAYTLGSQLTHLAPVILYNSPVERCHQTADQIYHAIIDNSGDCKLNGTIFDLGGPYIKGDWSELMQIIQKTGMYEFTRQWFNGHISSDLIMPLPEAALTQINVLLKQLNENINCTINISHDWNLMILLEYYFKLKHEDIGIPSFLDSISAYKTNDTIHLQYHHHNLKFTV